MTEATEPVNGGAGPQSQLCLIPKLVFVSRLSITDDFSFYVCQIRSLDVTLAGNDCHYLASVSHSLKKEAPGLRSSDSTFLP